MSTNERIALGLGLTRCPARRGPHLDSPPRRPKHWHDPGYDERRHEHFDARCHELPDYEHSLDALLEPLGVLRERGWDRTEIYGRDDGSWSCTLWRGIHGRNESGATMAEAVALAVAEALEASK